MRELTVSMAVEAVKARNGQVRALCTTTLDQALTRDQELEEEQKLGKEQELAPRQGGEGRLFRVPYSLKDVWDVAGLPTTRGSFLERHRVATASSPVHLAFEAAGAVLVGKSNMSDHGLTPESESWVGGVTRNPLDPARTAGGSSGGAAAAIASGMAAFDWGTDFGGSIRLPAAFCGVVGMRLSTSSWPIPHDGCTPEFVRRLNGMGPLARDLPTCAAVLEAAAPLRRLSPALPPLRGFLSLRPDAFSRGSWSQFEREIGVALRRTGHPVWPAPLPSAHRIDDTFVGLVAAHSGELLRGRVGATLSALTLGPRLGDRRLHPRSARVLVELSLLRWLRDRDPAAACERAHELKRRVDTLFAEGFVLVTPTATHPAPKLGRALSTRGLAAFVKLGNVVDATALAFPFGRFPEGLPRSLQLLGPPGSEQRLLELAMTLSTHDR